MITPSHDGHCWEMPLGGYDPIHFETSEAALNWARDYAENNGLSPAEIEADVAAAARGLVELVVPCWIARCDRCGEHEENDDGVLMHIPAYAKRHAEAELEDLVRVGLELVCEACRDRAREQARIEAGGVPVPHGRPVIIDQDDVARLIGLAVAQYDAGRLLGTPDQAFVAGLSHLPQPTSTGAAAGPVAVNTASFVVALPLPGMPATTVPAAPEVTR